MTITGMPSLSCRAVATDRAPAGPYAQAILAKGGSELIFVAGQLPVGPDGVAVGGEVDEQVTVALSNALAVLAAAGGTPDDIARVVVYTTVLDQAAEINHAYQAVLGDSLPARSMVGVSALPKGALVEVELTAAVTGAGATPFADNQRSLPVSEPTTNVDTAPTGSPVGGLDAGALRQYTPAVASTVYLNSGTCGPLLAPAAAMIAHAAQDELLVGRIGYTSFQALRTTMESLRAGLARLVGAGEDEIALTHHTTEGMNIITWGLDWSPGDRVVTTTLEHGGGLLPLYQLRRRLGVEVDFAEIGTGSAERTLDAISRALDRPAKLLVLSHVTYGTGAVLPLAEIVSLAHSKGVLVAVDGAQSVGAMPVRLNDLGVDFYAFPGQKWLCGPEGTGGLYVRRGLLDDLATTFIGFFGIDHDGYRADDPESLAPATGASRYEVGSVYRPAIYGFLEAVRWHLGTGSEHDTADRIARLTSYAMTATGELPGARMLTPPDAHAGLVSFTLPGIDPTACVAYLYERGVTVRSIPENGALRLSCGFFNTREDVDRALSLIGHYRDTHT